MPTESMVGVCVCRFALGECLYHDHTPHVLCSPQAKSTAEYIQASKARIAQYEQQVRLDFA